MVKVKKHDCHATIKISNEGELKITNLIALKGQDEIFRILNTKDYYSKYDLQNNGLYGMIINLRKGWIFKNKIKGIKVIKFYQIV